MKIQKHVFEKKTVQKAKPKNQKISSKKLLDNLVIKLFILFSFH